MVLKALETNGNLVHVVTPFTLRYMLSLKLKLNKHYLFKILNVFKLACFSKLFLATVFDCVPDWWQITVG